MIKSLWASIQGDPVLMRRINGWLTVFFALLIIPSFLFGWVESTTFVSALSLWALVSGHLSAWQAARVEVAQQEEAKRHEEEDIAEDVVEKIVDKTELDRIR